MIDKLWDELKSLTKPVSEDEIMQCAEGILDGTQMFQFKEWFKTNGMRVLYKLNGINNNG